MLTFFDFFYRSCCSLYKKDDSPEFAGVLIVALFQAFNILAVIMFFGVIIENTKDAYTSKLRYEILNGKWEVKSSKTKVRIRLVQTLYVIISVLLLFLL